MQIIKGKFNIDVPVSSLSLEDDDLKFWTSQNTQNLGELFYGFLNYYADFK